MGKIKDYFKLFKFTRTLTSSIPLFLGYAIAIGFKFSLTNALFFLLIFLSFSIFLYPGLYIINDLFDLKLDRKHPEKRKRPLASKRISVKTGAILSLVFIIIGLFSAILISETLFYFELLFVALNFLYSAYFKHIAYIDILSNAVTPTLRFIVGMVLFTSQISILPFLGVFMVVTFVCAFKREHEILRNQTKARKSLKKYKIEYFYLSYILLLLILLIIMPFTTSIVMILFLASIIFLSISIIIYHFSYRFQEKMEMTFSHY